MFGEKNGQRIKSKRGSGFRRLFYGSEEKIDASLPMKKFSRIRLLFPMFGFLLCASCPSYCGIAHLESTTATCREIFETATSRTRLLGTSTTSSKTCRLRRKLYLGIVTPVPVWPGNFDATFTSTPTPSGADSVSPAITLEATAATVFSKFINCKAAGSR
jgi:hypothetical protein